MVFSGSVIPILSSNFRPLQLGFSIEVRREGARRESLKLKDLPSLPRDRLRGPEYSHCRRPRSLRKVQRGLSQASPDLHDRLVNMTSKSHGVAQDLILDVWWPRGAADLLYVSVLKTTQQDSWASWDECRLIAFASSSGAPATSMIICRELLTKRFRRCPLQIGKCLDVHYSRGCYYLLSVD